MIIPFRHDAPVYHRPFATTGIIAVCVAVYLGTWTGTIDPERWWLDYDAFDPLQWVTANFLHAGFVHLTVNMVFLWVFGMIVEGKVGALRFLGIYLAIGVLQCAVEQILFSDGASLGASAIIFGLIGIGLIWAPENDVTFAYFWMPIGGTFDARVRTVAYFYVAWELFWTGFLFLCGYGVTSSLLHLMGLAVGIPVGIVMLRKGWVDCERWDWFSVRRGDHRRDTWMARRRRAEAHLRHSADPRPVEETREMILARLRSAIATGRANDAAAMYERVPEGLAEADLRALGDLLFASAVWDPCRAALKEHARRFPGRSEFPLMRLAAIAMRQDVQPRSALRLLAMVRRDALSADDAARYDALAAEAERLRAETPLELADDEVGP